MKKSVKKRVRKHGKANRCRNPRNWFTSLSKSEAYCWPTVTYFSTLFLYFSFLNFRTNDDERSLGSLQKVESLQQIPISGKHLFKQEGDAT
jgi:hypothetical protein